MSNKTQFWGSERPPLEQTTKTPDSPEWMERFQKEPADPKRGMRMIQELLPKETEEADKRSRYRRGDITLAGQTDEEIKWTEDQQANQAAEARQKAGWLRATQALLEKMMPGEAMVRWDTAAQELGWTPDQGMSVLHFAAHALIPHVEEEMRVLQSQLKTGVINEPNGLKQETERLLALRDAKGLLRTMERLKTGA